MLASIFYQLFQKNNYYQGFSVHGVYIICSNDDENREQTLQYNDANIITRDNTLFAYVLIITVRAFNLLDFKKLVRKH